MPETVDQGTNLGQCASIFLDSTGNVHISYYNRIGLGVKYAALKKRTWITETVDSGNVGPQSSIIMDDVVRIAYFDRGNEDLKYAVKTGDGWKISILVSEGATGYYPSMAILPSGQKLIAYYDKTEEAIY